MNRKFEIQQRVRTVANLLEQGHTRESIVTGYAEKWNVTDRSIDRYIAFAKDIVAGKMQKRDELIDEMRAEVIKEEAEKWLRSNLEIEAKLCSIMEGDSETFRITQDEKGKKRTTWSKPTHGDIIRAIDRLCKIRGMYDPKVRKASQSVVMEYRLENPEDMKFFQKEEEQPGEQNVK